MNISIGMLQSAASMLVRPKEPTIRKRYFNGKKVRSLEPGHESSDSEYPIDFSTNSSSVFAQMLASVGRKSSVTGLSKYNISSNNTFTEEKKKEQEELPTKAKDTRLLDMPLVSDVLKTLISVKLFKTIEQAPYNKLVDLIEENGIHKSFIKILSLYVPAYPVSEEKILLFLRYILDIKGHKTQKVFFILPLDKCAIALTYIPTDFFIKTHNLLRKKNYEASSHVIKNNVIVKKKPSIKKYRVREIETKYSINILDTITSSKHYAPSNSVKEVKMEESEHTIIKLKYLPYLLEKVYLYYKDNFASIFIKVLGVFLVPIVTVESLGYTQEELDAIYIDDYKKAILKQIANEELKKNTEDSTVENTMLLDTDFTISPMIAKLSFAFYFICNLSEKETSLFFSKLPLVILQNIEKYFVYYLFLYTRYNLSLQLKGIELSSVWLLSFKSPSFSLIQRLYLLALMLPCYKDTELQTVFNNEKTKKNIIDMSNKDFSNFLTNINKTENTKALALILQRTLSK